MATNGLALCEAAAIHKSYGGVQALAGVDLQIRPGEVHAVVGENGAGKSTLMKILAGAETPDDGQVILEGRPVRLSSVREANHQGIAIVFQELSLFPDLDVLSNLFPSAMPTRRGVVQRSEMAARARPVLEELGLSVDLNRPVGSLRLPERQLVEIAKALLADSRVLILDEPNSALAAAETERLFAVIRRLRDRGVALLYISHRLEEVFEIADRITVMRNGLIVRTVNRSATQLGDVVVDMIGHRPEEMTDGSRAPSAAADECVEIHHLAVTDQLVDASLRARRGEVLGLAGLEGSGIQTVFDVLFGVTAPTHGSVRLPGGVPAPLSVPSATKAGIALIPADRRSQGLALNASVADNALEVTAGALGRFGFLLAHRRMRQRVLDLGAQLRITMRTPETTVQYLSGGNQQKVVLAKWLDADPQIVLLNDPTRGVDVGSKEEIYRIIRALAEGGRVVIFSTTELTEYVTLCDRVVVFYRGAAVGEIERANLSTRVLLEAINTGRWALTATADEGDHESN